MRGLGQLGQAPYPKNMSDSYIQNLFAERIGGVNYGKDTAIYKFEKIKRAKKAALDANPGAEIIDMGVGEPDEMAFPEVVDKLHEEAQKPENRGGATFECTEPVHNESHRSQIEQPFCRRLMQRIWEDISADPYLSPGRS